MLRHVVIPHVLILRIVCVVLLLVSGRALADDARILVLGDSLSAAYGIEPQQGWVKLLEHRLGEKYPYRVINASVSGETSGGGLSRLPALLEEHQPSWVILELGANDGLRGHPLNVMQHNLVQIIEKSRSAGAQVLLLGMEIPPNYGQRYAQQFRDSYVRLAKQYQLPFVTFFLDKVALNANLMQGDGLHPNAEAQPILLENVWTVLQPLLQTQDNSAS